jgi:hypothetical protein
MEPDRRRPVLSAGASRSWRKRAAANTLLPYESHDHRPSQQGAGDLAGAEGRRDGCLAGQARPGSAREGTGERLTAVVHAPGRRCSWPEGPLDSQGLLPLVKGIADTGFLVAFANRDDRHHEWAVRVAERVSEPLLTCEAVLAETAFHLRSASLVLAMLREGLAVLAFDCRDHLPQLEARDTLRRSPAGLGRPVCHPHERGPPATQRHHHGPGGLPCLLAQQARGHPPRVSTRCVKPVRDRRAAGGGW